MTTCSFTLGGTCCNSLEDIRTFIVKIRDEPLFKGSQCCTDGSVIGANCSCPAAKDAAKTCIFDTCFDWPEVYTLLNNLQAQWTHNNLAPLLIAGATGLWGFFGSQGQATLANRIPIFYSTTGGLVGIVSGVLAAIWIGKTAIEVSVKQTYTSATPGSTFKTYGGNSFVGDLLGFTEALYVVAYIVMAGITVSAPLELAFKMDQEFKKADAAAVTATNYEFLTYGIIIALGSWFGAVAINASAESLLGFFDRQQTNAGDIATTSGFNQDEDVTNLNAILVDSIHHTLTIIFYYMVAFTISGGSYYYVYKQLVPEDQQKF
jgi:hypothetical protein